MGLVYEPQNEMIGLLIITSHYSITVQRHTAYITLPVLATPFLLSSSSCTKILLSYPSSKQITKDHANTLADYYWTGLQLVIRAVFFSIGIGISARIDFKTLHNYYFKSSSLRCPAIKIFNAQ